MAKSSAAGELETVLELWDKQERVYPLEDGFSLTAAITMAKTTSSKNS
jgi:hypothetical protein